MTLEKLLIFGFALAALMAITTLSSDVWTKRTNSSNEIEDKFESFGS